VTAVAVAAVASALPATAATLPATAGPNRPNSEFSFSFKRCRVAVQIFISWQHFLN
jgi:hypothetical protein